MVIAVSYARLKTDGPFFAFSYSNIQTNGQEEEEEEDKP